MRVLCVIILVIVGVFFLSYFGIERLMTPNRMLLLENTPIASELDIYHSENSIYYKNKDAIISLTSLMRNKVARVARNKNYGKYRNQVAVISFDYGYKGRSYFIDDEGRIVVSYRKYEFARDSWFIPYRFIWSANSNILYYVTDPDRNVKVLVDQMKKEMKI